MSTIYNNANLLLPMRYRIKEGTKNEYVAAGSNGNILRWSGSNKPDQEWLFQPIGNNRYHIITCQEKRANQRMAVGANGNVLVWAPTDKESQYFKLERIPDTDKFHFKEFTRNEYVAVGADGNILRWRLNKNKESFKFRIEPARPVPKPPALSRGKYDPDDIPIFPRLKSFDINPSPETDLYLIAETIVPAFHVDDHYYSSKLDQYDHNPFYVIRREQYWKRQSLNEFTGYVGQEKKLTVKTGMTTAENQSMESTIKMSIGASFGFKFAPEVGFDGISLKGPETSRSFTTEFCKELKMASSTSTTAMKEQIEETTVTLKDGKRVVLALWTLCDRFTLLAKDKVRVLKEWDVIRPGVVKRDAYPALSI